MMGQIGTVAFLTAAEGFICVSVRAVYDLSDALNWLPYPYNVRVVATYYSVFLPRMLTASADSLAPDASAREERLFESLHQKGNLSYSPPKSVSSQTSYSDTNPERTDKDDKDRPEIAVEDDDIDKWEDDNKASGIPPFNLTDMFRRVDLMLNLSSRYSMLTEMLKKDKTPAVRNTTSRFSRIVRPSRSRPFISINVPQSSSQPSKIHFPAPECPQTSRQNMLSCELSGSLRDHILWKRREKKSTIDAASKRNTEGSQNWKACNTDFDYNLFGLPEYHQKGW
jgi:hypothetical protein